MYRSIMKRWKALSALAPYMHGFIPQGYSFEKPVTWGKHWSHNKIMRPGILQRMTYQDWNMLRALTDKSQYIKMGLANYWQSFRKVSKLGLEAIDRKTAMHRAIAQSALFPDVDTLSIWSWKWMDSDSKAYERQAFEIFQSVALEGMK